MSRPFNEYGEWNRKMIRNSAKMMRLLLILLIIWTLFLIGWIVHLILLKSYHHMPPSPPEAWYIRDKRSDSVISYADLHFYTFVNWNSTDLSRIKTFIGGFHQLKESQGKVPQLTIYLHDELTLLQKEESSTWNKVEIKPMSKMKGDIKSLHESSAIWVSSDYTFDPVALELRRAEMLDEAEDFRLAFKKGRNALEYLSNGCIDLIHKGKIVFKSSCKKRTTIHQSKEYGLHGITGFSKGMSSLSCHVDVIENSIENGAEIVDNSSFIELEAISRSELRKLAIGVPTTSKGMNPGEKHVLLTSLIPSLKKTLEKDELDRFKIVVFVGFDHGDEFFDDESTRDKLRDEMIEILPNKVTVIFLRLKPIGRVAMTWNMIFHLARRHVHFDFFYQVNDDLTIWTRGWLTRFSKELDKTNGIGVVGPSDSFNGFSCSLLTQSFVSDKHFQIFLGNLYPLVFRDWKSDRWLSFVYGAELTRCWIDCEARNGAKGTRYEACRMPEWKIYLEAGKERIRKNIHLIG